MKRKIKGWAVFSPSGQIMLETVRSYDFEAIVAAETSISQRRTQSLGRISDPWDRLIGEGFSCQKVTIQSD